MIGRSIGAGYVPGCKVNCDVVEQVCEESTLARVTVTGEVPRARVSSRPSTEHLPYDVGTFYIH